MFIVLREIAPAEDNAIPPLNWKPQRRNESAEWRATMARRTLSDHHVEYPHAILAMYIPSLFSGKLIQRFGECNIMIAGSVLLGTSALASLTGHDVPHYWIGLVLLGVGWNFLFTAGESRSDWVRTGYQALT